MKYMLEFTIDFNQFTLYVEKTFFFDRFLKGRQNGSVAKEFNRERYSYVE